MKIYKFTFAALIALVFAGCSMMQQTASPTQVLKNFVEASKKKDVETMKQLLSSGTMKMIESTAKAQNMSVEDALKKDDGGALKELPETRNEKIDGDTASVEVKNPTNNDWDKIPFVKEDGKWKIALDVFMKDLMQKMSDQMKMPASNGAGNTSTAAPANK